MGKLISYLMVKKKKTSKLHGKLEVGSGTRI